MRSSSVSKASGASLHCSSCGEGVDLEGSSRSSEKAEMRAMTAPGRPRSVEL